MRATQKNLITVALLTIAVMALERRGFGIPFIGGAGVVSKDASTSSV